ncbi:MAG: hypothetical protein ACWGOV_01090 [Acidiferrobacterales bacterium]
MLQTELLIGAAGWENENWIGGFYPADLPEDWHFGYYTNRLRSVLVPANLWWSPEVDAYVDTMLEDLYPEFRMVLQWELPAGDNAPAQAADFLERSRPVDENVDAYLVKVSTEATSTGLQAVELLQQRHPVCLTAGGTEVGPGWSGLEGVSLCWLADTQAQPAVQGRFLVTLTSNTEPRGIREIIEKIDAWPDGLSSVQGAALFFTNDKAADTAFQARTIAELMGV